MKYSLSLLLPFLLTPSVSAYNLVKTYQGSTFFDNWNYISSADTFTNGDVVFQSRDQAGNLTQVNSAGNAVIRVDDFSLLEGDPIFQKRRSIRLESPDIFNQSNAVLVYDVAHIPFGCSVWGSLWTKSGISQWPQGGEVDIFEAVNKMPNNQMALHTKSACKIAQTNPGQTGTVISPDCQLYTAADGTHTNTAGCTVSDPSTNSYSTFDSNNGGVWVAEYAPTGVNIWFFQHSAVPSTLGGNTLDTSTLGTPTAQFPNSDQCDFSQALDPQQMVIDITLCGDWAGANDTLASTGCALTNTSKCYFQYVFDTNNYHEAYFELASIKIYGDDTTFVSNGTSTSSGSNSTPTTTHNWGSRLALWTPLAILPAVLATIFM